MKKEKLHIIQQAHIFKDLLSLEEQQTMLAYAKLVTYKKYDTIFNRGSTKCDAFYIIGTGSVGLILDNGVFKQHFQGDIFGEVAVFNRTFRSGTIYAVESSTLLEIHRIFYLIMKE